MRVLPKLLIVVAVVLTAASLAWADPPESDRRGKPARGGPDRGGDDVSKHDSDRSGRVERHHYGGYRPPSVVHWGGAYRVPYSPSYGYPVYPDYYPAYPGYYPAYPGYSSWYPPFYAPPIHIPAEELYGPRAVQRFMGVDHWFQQPQPSTNIIIQRGAEPAGDAASVPPPEDAKPPRATNQQALNLAWRFIGFGDAHFGNSNYAEANDRYRKAATASPQLADSYFRQGYALMAMGRYDLAVGAIRRGLALAPGWPQSGFSNTELYGDNRQAKAAHLETLAAASEKAPNDADLLFLVGVCLHFDGKPERARPFFERADQLLAEDDAYVKAFLVE